MKLVAVRKTGKTEGLLCDFDVFVEAIQCTFRGLKFTKVKDKNTGAFKYWVNYPAKFQKITDDKFEELYKWYQFHDERSSDFLTEAKRLVQKEFEPVQEASIQDEAEVEKWF